MAKEKSLWDRVNSAMGGLWHAQRHEDKHSVGIPDVSFGMHGTNGWIELKQIAGWPKKGNIVKVPHFTPQQINWLWERDNKGGNCWLLLQVRDEYLLFKGVDCGEVGYCNERKLRENVYSSHTADGPQGLRLWLFKNLLAQREE